MANGPAQHKPFIPFAYVGHLTLFFILLLIKGSNLWNFRMPNIIPHVDMTLKSHIIA
jgi:hypothetical protein